MALNLWSSAINAQGFCYTRRKCTFVQLDLVPSPPSTDTDVRLRNSKNEGASLAAIQIWLLGISIYAVCMSLER